MKLEQYHLIKRLPSRTRVSPAKNFIIYLEVVSTFEGALGLDNGDFLRLVPPPPIGGFLNAPLLGLTDSYLA